MITCVLTLGGTLPQHTRTFPNFYMEANNAGVYRNLLSFQIPCKTSVSTVSMRKSVPLHLSCLDGFYFVVRSCSCSRCSFPSCFGILQPHWVGKAWVLLRFCPGHGEWFQGIMLPSWSLTAHPFPLLLGFGKLLKGELLNFRSVWLVWFLENKIATLRSTLLRSFFILEDLMSVENCWLRLTVEREVNVDLEETWKSRIFEEKNSKIWRCFFTDKKESLKEAFKIWWSYSMCGFCVFFFGGTADLFGGLLLTIKHWKAYHWKKDFVLPFCWYCRTSVHVLVHFVEPFPKNRTAWKTATKEYDLRPISAWVAENRDSTGWIRSVWHSDFAWYSRWATKNRSLFLWRDMGPL